MKLHEMCLTNRYGTDKYYEYYGWHSYVENIYDIILEPVRDSVKKFLEIGINDGGSLQMWRDYFQYSIIIGADITIKNQNLGFDRIIQIHADAYTESFLNVFPDEHFDIIIDDGPHTPETQIFFMKNYFQKLSKNGIMVCEDISSPEVLEQIISVIPENARERTIFDLRERDSRFDSLVLVVRK